MKKLATILSAIISAALSVTKIFPYDEELSTEKAVKAMLFMTENGKFIPVIISRNPIDGKRLKFGTNISWFGNPVPCIKGTDKDYPTHGVTIYWAENHQIYKVVSTLSYFEEVAKLNFVTSFGFLRGKTIKEALSLAVGVAGYANSVINEKEKYASVLMETSTKINSIVNQKWFINAISDAKGVAKKF